jgi:hypothetical protein
MKLRDLFKLQFPRVDTIGSLELVRIIHEEILPLKFKDQIPITIIVLDEVQSYIGENNDIAESIRSLAEVLCSQFKGRFLLIGTGQSAITGTKELKKLMARFRIPIQLTNTDIQTVIRKTILEKKPTSIVDINTKLESVSGEISRSLEGTVFGYTSEDKKTLIADYPLLPSVRKFWYTVLRVTDVAGTSGQLRGQLRLINDGLMLISEKALGYIIPADFIFTQNRSDLIQAGLLLNETSNLIQGKKAQGGDIEIEGRILSAVFLLDQITSNDSRTGLKSNDNTIADLLIDNLNVNSDAFRTKVKELIKKLVDEKVLMPINSEYKLQTKIGAEWEQEFTRQYIKLNNSGDDQIQSLRREKIVAHFKEKTKGISVTQGNSKTVRDFELWDKDTAPNTEHKLNLWIRDGWFENESTVKNEILASGNNTPLAYAFIKKFRDPELRTEIIKFLATGLAINAMGLPTTPEAEQAKKSMETRQSQAKTVIQELIEEICKETIIYLAGGNQVQTGIFKENIQEALNSIADRQFPEFKSKADFSNWGQALNRALAGNPDSLNAINYTGDVDKHPVASEILRDMGNSAKTGRDIRIQFMKAPFGWPQDAIDTMLIMLKNMQHISTTETSLLVARINQASFKRETIIITPTDKIKIRSLFQTAGINCPPNHEIFSYSNEFLTKLKTLSYKVGGDAPRPEPINIDFIKEIEDKEGNERLVVILQQRDDLVAKFNDWTAKAKLVSDREPDWTLLVDLMNHAPDEAEMDQLKTEAAAIKDGRLILQEPDLIQPILFAITDKLLGILNKRKEQYNALYDVRMADLQANEYFKKLAQEQKHSILAKHQLLVKPEIKTLEGNALLNQLQKASLYTWDTKIAALPGQFQSAMEEAVLLSAPQAKTFSLPRKTISNQAEIDSYVAELKIELETLLKESSSIILK